MDNISAARRSANMRRIRSKGMKPEIAIRRLVHALGYRFRLHRSDLPGSPDLVFPARRKAIFVHGCFWHQHDDSSCRRAHVPRSNSDYWKPKLARNLARDRAGLAALADLGWDTLVVWECQLSDTSAVTAALSSFLGRPGSRGGGER